MIKRFIKFLLHHTYRPFLLKYLSKKRVYRYRDIRLAIPPGVFHPGLFFSTKMLLRYIAKLNLADKTFLELGAGSGLISIYAAKQKAKVIASDINPDAVEAVRINAKANQAPLLAIESDLFQNLPQQRFDVIVVNPPYYKKDPVTYAEHAWYCGKNGEYFQNFFAGLNNVIHEQTICAMVLSDGCDIEMIKQLARQNHFTMDCTATKKNLLERNFIYEISRMKP